MSEFIIKIFRPDDFVGLLLVLLAGFAYLWRWAGRPPKKTKTPAAANCGDSSCGQSFGTCDQAIDNEKPLPTACSHSAHSSRVTARAHPD